MCQALEPKKTGPTVTRESEEARRIKLEQMAACHRHRRAILREAREAGQELPTFTRGRPRKYTPEEAKEAKAQQNKECLKTYRKRVREGVIKLTDMYLEQTRSSAD